MDNKYDPKAPRGNEKFDEHCQVIIMWGDNLARKYTVHTKTETRKLTHEFLGNGYNVCWSNALQLAMRSLFRPH